MKTDELDITARRLVALAVKAGYLAVDAVTGEIEGLCDPDAEGMTYRLVSVAARNGELGFVDRDQALATIEAIITHAHPGIED
jgi:hypothetical protein